MRKSKQYFSMEKPPMFELRISVMHAIFQLRIRVIIELGNAEMNIMFKSRLRICKSYLVWKYGNASIFRVRKCRNVCQILVR